MERPAIHMQIWRGVFPQTVTSHVTVDITTSKNNLVDLLAEMLLFFLHLASVALAASRNNCSDNRVRILTE